MKHIVIIPYHIASKLNPTFMLAKRLRQSGYRITIVGPSSLSEATRAQGLPFVAAGNGSARPKPPTEKENRLKYLIFASKHIETAVDALGMDNVPELLKELQADLILIDVEQHRYTIAAVPTGIPVVIFSTFVSLFKRAGLPPAHLDIIPGVGLKGSGIGIEYAWLRFRYQKLKRRLRTRVKERGLDMASIMRRLAHRTGFDFRRQTDPNQWVIPFVYRKLPHLALMSKEFDFPHSPPPLYHHVGALIDQSRHEVVAVDQDPESTRLNTLLTQHKDTQADRKLIYCSFGAFYKGDDIGFWKKIIKALGTNSNWTVILGLGGRLEPSSLGQTPKNVHAFKWVPQLRVLEYTDCAIIHGGITSINECILCGVPMIVYPFETTDQHGAAARVVYHGVGLRGHRSDDALAIRNHVMKILKGTTFAAKVLDMKKYFLRDLEKNTAVSTIGALLSQSNES